MLSNSPEAPFQPTLADLSRNASVISTSSSSDSLPPMRTPIRPRPGRTFTSPRIQSSGAPVTAASRPPSYLTKDLDVSDANGEAPSLEFRTAASKARSRSRNPSVNGRLSVQDFQFGATLGEGSYSTVIQATYLATSQEYAVKVLDKAHLIRHGKVPTVEAEKNALIRLGSGHPGFIRLSWTFHDEWSLYFVLDLARNGEMQSRIARMGSLSTECARYYCAQIVDAMEYMHSKGVIHRDLKPENLLLDDAYRIKMTDFGTAKNLEPGVNKAKTFVGTAQYQSPELLEANETSRSSDLWALGCVLYQMISGRFAFQGASDYLTWQKIKKLEYNFPDGFDLDAKDLVSKLLVLDPLQRLGAGQLGSSNDMKALRSHPFLISTHWDTLWSDPAPPLEPGLFKKNPAATTSNMVWEDVGAKWDEIVSTEDLDTGDEMGWAADGEGSEFEMSRPRLAHLPSQAVSLDPEEGPMGEPVQYSSKQFVFPTKAEEEVAPATTSGTVLPQDEDAEPPTLDKDTTAVTVPTRRDPSVATVTDAPLVGGLTTRITVSRRNPSTGSVSSSEESPTGQLGLALEAVDLNRGRDRSLTPIQGNGSATALDSLMALFPGETILYESSVEERSLKRRASILLAVRVAVPVKPKSRHLILTTHRLICLKPQKLRGATIKSDFALAPPDRSKGKEKEYKTHVTGVELKGAAAKEFIVITSGKSRTYAAPSATQASTWVHKIHEAISPKQA